MKNLDWGSFFTNILAVVLGIFITFGIQGLIDSKAEKKDVMSAIELVKEELTANMNDLQGVLGIIDLEKSAAVSLHDNLGNLNQCDPDSIRVWNTILGSKYFFTVTDDALELLKSSSLFQKINDKNLALGIIKAYDYLGANAQAFNTHEQYKITLYEDANNEKARKAALESSGTDFLKRFYSSAEADYFLKSVIEMSSDSSFLILGIPEIEATIADIEARLK